MAGLHTLIIGWQGKASLQKLCTFRLTILEMLKQVLRISFFKNPGRKLYLGAVENIAIIFAALFSWPSVPVQVLDIIHALNKHRQTFQPIGQL